MNDLISKLNKAYRMDETEAVNELLTQAQLTEEQQQNIQFFARKLVIDLREERINKAGIDNFLAQYDLSSEEGIALMCLAEALLRIPDKSTIDKLIVDKISSADWDQHLGKSQSIFVNAATWALMLTGKIVNPQRSNSANMYAVLRNLIRRTGAPIIRKAVSQAIKILGYQFVMGETIEEALERAKSNADQGYTYSYDMLGEEALTSADADKYYQSYLQAIEAIATFNVGKGVYKGSGISIKLSALHPRYDWRKREQVLTELYPKLLLLAQAAKKCDIGLTIDAEEAERLVLSLELIEKLAYESSLDGWQGLGLAVQAYQKRAPYVLDFIIELARKSKKRIMVRLVKGAYWDAEIKNSQERGLSGYPVFTRKASTDVSYIACVKKILAATDAIYPQFATHNAYSVAVVLELTRDYKDFEFQCLHGMGEELYTHIKPCRVYAPVGDYHHLLAYLVRRLLENGANTSFVNRIVDENTSVDELISDPIKKMQLLAYKPHPKIPLPANLYGEARPNSHGIDFTNPLQCQETIDFIADYALDKSKIKEITREQLEQALQKAKVASLVWSKTEVETRIRCFERMASLLEKNKNELMAILVHEAGKTLNDAIAEVREAVDFCWYYASRARLDFHPQPLTGPTGEYNQLQLYGRGVIACISPWNFPLAIFLGQVSAALLAGNAVLAKPAAQTPIVALKAIEFLHLAGVPTDVVQLLIGRGSVIGDALTSDLRVSGIMFTGSTETARHINQKLASRDGPIVPFVAETGGQNVMIVDSSALTEQVVKDIITSSFGSAGQRCSSLRVLYLQEEIADKTIKMLVGALQQLTVGFPGKLSTDIGPVIDQASFDKLTSHKHAMQKMAKLIYEVQLPDNLPNGKPFFAPCAFEIENIRQLEGEVFGPILHVVLFKSEDLESILADISSTGFGLTLGIHSRIDDTIDFIIQNARVGNIYVNRNMIGAVVGVQPFGGEGLSGTGPKAGGPHYLPRLATERTLSINTAAVGGNATVLSLQE